MSKQVTEEDVIQTCEVHGLPLDPAQLEVVVAVVNQVLLGITAPQYAALPVEAECDPFPLRLVAESDVSLAWRVDSWHQRNPAPAPQDGDTANASGDGFCEHQWEPMTDPHKECIKCGDVRPDLSANAQTPVAPHPAIARAISQEERACRAEDTLINLVNQLRKINPIDDHGHDLKMNRAYLEAEKLLDAALFASALPAQEGEQS